MLDHQPILIASRNEGKIIEITKLFAGLKIETKSLLEFESLVPPEETAYTYHENAFQKSLWAFSRTGLPALSDDSGIEIEGLDNKPGVRSARFMGADVSYETRNREILKTLETLDENARKARFVCVMVLMLNATIWFGTKGVISGTIAPEPRGRNGFGYDPVFIPDGYTETFAQMGRNQKNEISHRGKALRHVFTILERIHGM